MNQHAFFDTKEQGSCKSLTGRVMLTVVLVDEPNSSWTPSDIAELQKKQEVATAKLLEDAKQYGAQLEVKMNYTRCSVNSCVEISKSEEWAKEALEAAWITGGENVIPKMKALYQVKETPFLFAVNREGRSFAVANRNIEYAVLYKGHGDYRHELYHLFGAVDYYYPAKIKQAAQKYFPNSIMMVSENAVTDSLTAYLIGWTQTPSHDAERFLDETKWATRQYINEEIREETKTGKGTIRWGDGTYTGDLVAGVPYGKGRIVWDDGNTYEGDWVNGKGHGHGKMMWNTNGSSYVGEWKKWKMHGYGVYYYANGRECVGYWEEHHYIGLKLK